MDRNSHTFAVCAYRESEYLDECIRSLVDQAVPTNIILCTSTPNEMIRSAAKRYGLQLFESGGSSGIAADWNYALSKAQTPYVTIAHQDDVYKPEYTQHMLEAMGSMKRPLLFFSNYGELRNGEQVFESRLLDTKRRMLSALRGGKHRDAVWVRRMILAFGSAICCPTVTMALDNLPRPLFRDSLKSNLDWEAWSRVARIKGGFFYDPEVLMFHRIHGGSETSARIADDTRTQEDLFMLKQFWPTTIAYLINGLYKHAQNAN